MLSSLTDLLDGLVARKFDMVTELGKALDPIADKLTHAALAICLAIRYPLMWALIGLMAVKEGYMGIMGVVFLRKGKMLDGAMWFGKVCTAVLFVGLLLLFVFPHYVLFTCKRPYPTDDGRYGIYIAHVYSGVYPNAKRDETRRNNRFYVHHIKEESACLC